LVLNTVLILKCIIINGKHKPYCSTVQITIQQICNKLNMIHSVEYIYLMVRVADWSCKKHRKNGQCSQ